MIIDFDKFHSYEGSSAFTCPKCEKKVRYHIDTYDDTGINKEKCNRCDFEFKANIKIELIDCTDKDIKTVTITEQMIEDALLSSYNEYEDSTMWLHKVGSKLEYCMYEERVSLPFIPPTVHDVVKDSEIEENRHTDEDSYIIDYTVSDTIMIDNEEYNIKVVDE